MAVGVTPSLVGMGGLALSLWPAPEAGTPAGLAMRSEAEAQLRREFDQAVRLLREGRHEQAAIALHGVLVRAPTVPEAHANMGYALHGLGRNEQARGFFESASELRPAQANAYYGLAVALERLHDLPGAVGAMRTYVHLTHAADPHVRKARAALWEWEAQLALLRTGQAGAQEAQP